MAFVIDASLTLAWVFVDEATQYNRSVRERLATETVTTPTIWPLEVANALLVGERRQRIAESHVGVALQMLMDLPILVDSINFTSVWLSVVAIAREYRLSVYDASYL